MRARLNLPLALTLIRLVVAPLILPFLVYYLLPLQSFFIHSGLALLSAFVCITDFLDGYLARKYHQVTTLGKLLDPIADKFFFSAMLIALVAVHKFYFFWAVLLVGREFFVNGLRVFASQQQISVNVSFFGKLKTTFQGILLFMLIISPYPWFGQHGYYVWGFIEVVVLVITLYLSFYSAYKYFENVLRRVREV